MSFSFSSDLNAPLKIRPVDAWGPLQDYWNIQRSQADVGYTQAQTDYTKANTIKQQIDNELQRLQYGYQRAGWDIGSNKTGWQLPAPPQWPTPPDRVAPQKPQQGQQPDFSGGFGDETGGAQQPAATPPARQQQSQQQPAAPISPTTGKPMPLSGGSDQAALPTPPIPPGYDPTTGTRLAQGSDGNVYRVPAQPNQLAQMQPPGGGPPQQPGILGRYPGSYQTASLGQTPPPQGQGGGEQPIPPGVMQQAAQGATPAAAPAPQQQQPPAQRPPQAPPGRQQEQPENTGIVHIPDPPPGSGPPNPWARTDPSGTNGIDTSSLGLGVPTMPTMLGIAALRDPKAAAEALNMRRQALANAAAGATDLASWNRGVKSLDDQGWITHGEAAHYWNHPAYKETVLKQAMSAEAQSQLDQNLYGHGMEPGAYGHPRPSPTVAQSEAQVQAARTAAQKQYELVPVTVTGPDGTKTTYNISGADVPRFLQEQRGAAVSTARDIGFSSKSSDYQTALQAIPPQYRDAAIKAAYANNIPLSMLVATINTEQGGSNWDMRRVGTQGEVGLGQILPSTAPQIIGGNSPNNQPYTLDQLRTDPAANLDASAAYLRTMLDKNNGNIAGAAYDYNGRNNPEYREKWLTNYKPFGTVWIAPAGANVGGGGGQPGGASSRVGVPQQTERSQEQEGVWTEGNKRLDEDRRTLEARTAAGDAARAQIVGTRQMEDVAKGNPDTGAFGAIKMQISRMLNAVAPTANPDNSWGAAFIKAMTGADGSKAADWDLLNKMAVSMAGQASQTTGGQHSGLGLVELYRHAYPGPETTQEATIHMLHVFEVAHQQAIDQAQGARPFADNARDTFIDGNGKRRYTPLSKYDDQFNAPGGLTHQDVYVAAAAILNGEPPKSWKGKLSPEQQRAALDIAARAQPGGSVVMEGQDANGRYTNEPVIDPNTGKPRLRPLR